MLLFFGPDGSGKTTLARASAEHFKRKGLRVKVSWMRGTHTFASFIALFLSKFKVFEGSDNPYYNINIPPPMKKVWQGLEFISALPIIIVRYILPSLFGFYVIGERCFIDFIVWVAFTTGDESYLNGFASRVLLNFALKNNKAIYVTADFNTLLKRRTDVSADMLSKQQSLYEKVSNSVGAYILNTSDKSAESSLEKLMLMLEI